jgi:hypothetical protein
MFPRTFLTQAFGVIFLGLGLAARLGMWKKWYWGSRGAAYGYLPMGLVFVVYSFNDRAAQLLGSRYVLFQAGLVLLGLCALWWTVRPPAFVKPAWVRWVEAYPPNLLDAMAKAVKRGEEWEPHMSNPESIDAWVKSLKGKKNKSRAQT